MSRYLAAAVQMTSTSDAEANLRQVESLIRQAAGYGARFVGTPENTNYLGPHDEKARRAELLDGDIGSTCGRFSRLAAELEIHLLLGSFNERSPEHPSRCYNTSVLFGPEGAVLAVYRKIHLFDIDLSDQVRFLESETVVPGDEVVVAATELGRFGLSVCYDLRFPELYRRLRDGVDGEPGAEVITVPSAFTATTGRAHWRPLQRARAIETQSWVIAPAQWGRHDDGGLRESYGHALIVDPWGQVVAEAPEGGPGLALAEIDLERVHGIRRKMPVAEHRRL